MYDGHDNPLIVAYYYDANGEPTEGAYDNYGPTPGVFLTRKYTEPIMTYGENLNYTTSLIKQFLDNDYLTKCSDEVKSIISEVRVPCYYQNPVVYSFNAKWFLMSANEVCGGGGSIKGDIWNYWQNRTGYTSINDAANMGRVVTDSAGKATQWWTRTWSTDSGRTMRCVLVDGSVGNRTPSAANTGVLPACFIAKP